MEDDTTSENPQTSPNIAEVKNNTEEEQKNTDELGDSDSPNSDTPPPQRYYILHL